MFSAISYAVLFTLMPEVVAKTTLIFKTELSAAGISVAPESGDATRRCVHCSSKFGLIRHRWYTRQFCRKRCREAFLNKLAEDRQRLRAGATW
jgi:endogenous inhibitor of DNA gyrase (YacG/DUF329 family)